MKCECEYYYPWTTHHFSSLAQEVYILPGGDKVVMWRFCYIYLWVSDTWILFFNLLLSSYQQIMGFVTANPGGWPLSAGPSSNVQESSEGWIVSVTVWTSGGAGYSSHSPTGAIPHASGTVCLPIQHLLWGLTSKWSHCRWVSLPWTAMWPKNMACDIIVLGLHREEFMSDRHLIELCSGLGCIN